MKTEKDLYDILSPKFEEREVPFNMEDWKSMRTMIDASRAAKRRTVWLMASLGLLLCAGGTVILYKVNTDNGKQNTISTVEGVNKASKSLTVNNKQDIPLTSSSVTNSKIAVNVIHPYIVSRKDIVKKQVSTIQPNQKSLIVNSPVQLQSVQSNRQVTPPSVSQPLVSNKALSHNAMQNSIAQNSSQNNIPINMPIAAKMLATSPVLSKAVSSPETSNSNAAGSIAKPIVNKLDTIANTEELPQRFSDEPRIFRGKTNIFSVELGTQWSGGWQIGSVIQGKGVNPIIGVGYAHYMGHKTFLKTGLQLSSFGNMSTLPYNYQHTVGNTVYDSAITTKRLYFLRIPVQVERSIGHNNMKSSIGLGGSVWVLLGNSGFASTYQQTDNNPPVNTILYSQNAPLNGYTAVNVSAHSLYRYMVTRNFSMYGILYYEITSMKNNAFFGGSIIERTYGFEFTAAYSFN